MTDNLPPLLPCPFCGGEPSLLVRSDNIDGAEFICSVACYCGGYSATAHKMEQRPTPEQAKADTINAWNARAAIEASRAAAPAGFVLIPLDLAVRATNAIGLPYTSEHTQIRGELLDVLAAAPQPVAQPSATTESQHHQSQRTDR